MTTEPILVAQDIVVRFGGLTAVDGVSVDLQPGRITGLMGPNGAGKTTFFNTLSGHQPVTSGQVFLKGKDVTGLSAHGRARMGIARTFQLGGLVEDLSAIENIALGLDHGGRMTGKFLRRRQVRAAAEQILADFDLADVANRLGSDLGAGLRRRVEVARAMAAEASVVMLDEPAAGLTVSERDELAALLARVADAGTAILITEHSSDFLFNVSDEVVVMNFGEELRRGTPADIKNDPAVVAAYLG
ncbi:ABC transporter ATP-binding protein [Parafrigoribacterium mesophilum]|uniref:ABC transporter ATP-binding protein n=1 Tax=Parafrigoribacterium mesophilum TaxID=433646 RepID=UPI0031FCD299